MWLTDVGSAIKHVPYSVCAMFLDLSRCDLFSLMSCELIMSHYESSCDILPSHEYIVVLTEAQE